MIGVKIEHSAQKRHLKKWGAILQVVKGFAFGENEYFFPDKSVEDPGIPIDMDGTGVITDLMTRGLSNNTGRSCYKNSVLQLLAHVPPLAKLALRRVGNKKEVDPENYEEVFFSGVLASLFDTDMLQHRMRFEYDLAPALRDEALAEMPDTEPHCAAEYLNVLLERLISCGKKEWSNRSSSDLQSEVGRIFGFVSHRVMTCVNCGDTLELPTEQNRFLFLNFPDSAPPKPKGFVNMLRNPVITMQALYRRVAPVSRTFQEMMHSTCCSSHNIECRSCGASEISEATSIVVPPNVLLVVFARGRSDDWVRDNVDVPHEFSLEPYVLKGCGYDRIDNDYVLRGVINVNEGVGVPHFTAFCRKDKEWYYYNDSASTAVSEKTVLSCRKPYIAAYCRKEAVPFPPTNIELRETVIEVPKPAVSPSSATTMTSISDYSATKTSELSDSEAESHHRI